VSQTQESLGFYRNFEKCLSFVPAEAKFVALCDQDDFWFPDKLETLLAAFDSKTSLAYSDMRVVDGGGRLISGTYWTTRRNNFKSLTSLLVANTVTGAASVFRRDLLDLILPFPELSGQPFHDHWIACTALATGKIAYVDQPLYDYVQHAGNVVGHYVPVGGSWLQNAWSVVKKPAARDYAWSRYRHIYFDEVFRIETIAQLLEVRAGALLDRQKNRILARVRRMDQGLEGAVWLLFRRIRELWRGNETLGAETRLLRGVLWKHASAWLKGSSSTADLIREKIAPLKLAVSASAARRVNLLIPTVDFDPLRGGSLAAVRLAQKLTENQFRVRIVIVDPCDYRSTNWRQQLHLREGIGEALDSCEWTYAADRAVPLEVSPKDSFVATAWWTAHIAHQAAVALGRWEFLYLIQQVEPAPFPPDTFSSLARETYGWPHRALFSSPLVGDYFRQQRLGVFAGEEGERKSDVFETAISRLRPSLDRFRETRKLLLYARTELDTERSMFELGVVALRSAIEAGVFDASWEFSVAGSEGAPVPLARGRDMRPCFPRNHVDYETMLTAHDIGLSLMYAPYSSLVPLEMAAAGVIVVTNLFGGREPSRRISSNLISIASTVESIVAALRSAVQAADRWDERMAGSRVDWCTDWNQALNEEVMAGVSKFLKDLSA
jgi:hypothetical protein